MLILGIVVEPKQAWLPVYLLVRVPEEIRRALNEGARLAGHSRPVVAALVDARRMTIRVVAAINSTTPASAHLLVRPSSRLVVSHEFGIQEDVFVRCEHDIKCEPRA